MKLTAPTPGPRPTRVTEVMTRPFTSVRPHMRPADAASRMRHHGVHTAPVLTAEGHLVGVLSLSDLPKPGSAWPVDDDEPARTSPGSTVADLMSPHAVTVSPDTEITEAAEIMRRRGLHWLVVVDEQRHVVGVLSRSELPTGGMPRPRPLADVP